MQRIEERLFALQDTEYGDFHSRLMPGYDRDRIIGVRTPALRALAKELAREPESRVFLKELPHRYYEENNLHGLLIGEIFGDFDTALEMTEEFLPYIDNWATCDMFAPRALKKETGRLFDRTLVWLDSPHTYTVRYGLVNQLRYFLDDDTFRPQMLQRIAQIDSDEFYVNMAIAWYYSFALIRQYDATIPLFEEKTLKKWIHNKSLQKAVESRRIDKETKDRLRSLKIK